MVSYLKSIYGAAATKDNGFGYDWHPRIIGDHSHLPMFVAMNEGRVKGLLCICQNPAASPHPSVERNGLARVQWVVGEGNLDAGNGAVWQDSPGVNSLPVRSPA